MLSEKSILRTKPKRDFMDFKVLVRSRKATLRTCLSRELMLRDGDSTVIPLRSAGE
jgi:hypothetical protein